MTYQVFARKYRPQSFDTVIGQEGIVKTLQNAITLGRIHHAYLFCGARGVGKTSLARIYAKSLNCVNGPTATPCQTCASCIDITQGNSMDVLEIDGASNTGVDDVRELREQAKYLPNLGKYRIYIIDEVHMLSKGAFNALLKILEEPPAHVIFVFATTEPHKIPITILSRCQRFDCKRLSLESLMGHLKTILAEEKVNMPDDAVALVAAAGDGSVRDSLSLMDQVVSFCGNDITLEQVRDILGLTDRSLVMGALKAIVKADVNEVLAHSKDVYEKGADLKIFAEELLQLIHNLLLLCEGADQAVTISPSEKDTLKELGTTTDAAYCLMLFQILSRDIDLMTYASFPKLVLETSFLKMIRAREYLSIPQIMETLANPGAPSIAQAKPAASPNIVKTLPQAAAKPVEAAPVKVEAPKITLPAPSTNQGYMEFITRVSQTLPQIAGLIDHARPLTFSKEKILLGFDKNDILQRDMVQERIEKLKKVAEGFFGTVVPIELQLVGAEAALPSSANETRTRDEQARLDVITKRAMAHPGIQKAQELLGAKVAQVKELK